VAYVGDKDVKRKAILVYAEGLRQRILKKSKGLAYDICSSAHANDANAVLEFAISLSTSFIEKYDALQVVDVIVEAFDKLDYHDSVRGKHRSPKHLEQVKQKAIEYLQEFSPEQKAALYEHLHDKGGRCSVRVDRSGQLFLDDKTVFLSFTKSTPISVKELTTYCKKRRSHSSKARSTFSIDCANS